MSLVTSNFTTFCSVKPHHKQYAMGARGREARYQTDLLDFENFDAGTDTADLLETVQDDIWRRIIASIPNFLRLPSFGVHNLVRKRSVWET